MLIGSTLALGIIISLTPPAFSCAAPTEAASQGPVRHCIVFEQDQVRLEPAARTELDAIIAAYRSGRRIDLILLGSSEPSPSSMSCCVGLSQRRLHLVRAYLIDQGIGSDVITVQAFGEGPDVADGHIRILFGPGSGW